MRECLENPSPKRKVMPPSNIKALEQLRRSVLAKIFGDSSVGFGFRRFEPRKAICTGGTGAFCRDWRARLRGKMNMPEEVLWRVEKKRVAETGTAQQNHAYRAAWLVRLH